MRLEVPIGPDRACFSFVCDPDDVAAKIGRLIAHDPARAVTLCEAFLYTTEPVVKKVEKSRPDLAARLWRAQGLRIVDAKKSKYDDAALSNFESAKRCFGRAGLQWEWQKTVSQVRADHHRKSGFMDGFERLVDGVGPSDEPSFMEQAKARFRGRHRRTR